METEKKITRNRTRENLKKEDKKKKNTLTEEKTIEETTTNKIKTEEEWVSFIKKIKRDVDNSKPYNNIKTASDNIKRALEESIKSLPLSFGLCFSGGVDSNIIAYLSKKYNKDFTSFIVGSRESKDMIYATRVAEDYNLKKEIIDIDKISNDKIIEILRKLKKLLKTENYPKLSIALVTYLCSKNIKEKGYSFAVTGLGSEEIFAGYKRHLNKVKSDERNEDKINKAIDKDKINEECWNGLLNITYNNDFTRDYPIAKLFNLKLVSPFLNPKLIREAMKIPGRLKIKENNKIENKKEHILKYILRVACEELGLQHEYAFRKKIAAQYGSAIDKKLTKIAKLNNYKYKSEFIKEL